MNAPCNRHVRLEIRVSVPEDGRETPDGSYPRTDSMREPDHRRVGFHAQRENALMGKDADVAYGCVEGTHRTEHAAEYTDHLTDCCIRTGTQECKRDVPVPDRREPRRRDRERRKRRHALLCGGRRNRNANEHARKHA